ncbi:signal peptidase II [Haematobacter massiliensis]|uniref:Lipoprotein signal peptidase n=2 Tax=Haematobacter massiliensis TaxID=195105 RepID=A0A086Y124_9RHOB|nr:lipoprotein signal peptidase [Haematobacter massiliensis]OWJ70037.1 signal peptidase II [Haematobacter massiliensis]OWJ83342.1 signal peptidase II [Haematobacter massiliensis]QBJ23137.1 signal peptidase II [Haematobacter massiliensis]
MVRGSLGIMAGVAAATFALDQLSKFVVVHLMSLDRVRAIDVWPPYLNFRMAWNRGVNFGLLQGEGDLGRWLLIAVALVISVWVWLWMRKEPQTAAVQVSAGLLIGGAIGNVIDRILYGAVADFLNMSCCGIANPWAFNVADIAVFAGAIGLVLFTGRDKKA